MMGVAAEAAPCEPPSFSFPVSCFTEVRACSLDCFPRSTHVPLFDVRSQRPSSAQAGISTANIGVVEHGRGAKAPRSMQRSNITFCTTVDGTRLAVCTEGAGKDVIFGPGHFAEDLSSPGPGTQPWLDALLPRARVTRYDGRGMGLSDRHTTRCTPDAWLEDLDAIVQTLGDGPIAFVTHSHGAPLAVWYASLHPERVSHLVLYGGYLRGRSKRDGSERQAQENRAQREAILAGWGSDTSYAAGFRRVFISRFYPHADEPLLATLDARASRRWSRDVLLAYTEAAWELDMSEQARRVQCPTLVLHATRDQAMPLEEGRSLAAHIPGSRFIPIDSDNHLPMSSDADCATTMDEVKRFLGLDDRAGDGTVRQGTLTPRQLEVLRLVAAGQTDKQIARALALSPRTVEMHVGRALEALACHTRAEGVRKAVELRLLR